MVRNRSRRLAAGVAAVAILGLCEATPAFVGQPDPEWPLRYRVRVLARFTGESYDDDDDDWDGDYWQSETARKLEVDVLSIDGPDTFHWEKPLDGGLLLDGTYIDNPSRKLYLTPDRTEHVALLRGRFPFIRKAGTVRVEAQFMKVSADLSKLTGSTRYRVRRDALDYYRGKVYVRVRGKRILPGE